MDASIVTGLMVLAGTLIGGLAGVAGNIVTSRYSNHSERRRQAVDAGFREWEHSMERAKTVGGVSVNPPVLFIHFNDELLKLIDTGDLTPQNYRTVLQRRDDMKRVIDEDNARPGRKGGA